MSALVPPNRPTTGPATAPAGRRSPSRNLPSLASITERFELPHPASLFSRPSSSSLTLPALVRPGTGESWTTDSSMIHTDYSSQRNNSGFSSRNDSTSSGADSRKESHVSYSSDGRPMTSGTGWPHYERPMSAGGSGLRHALEHEGYGAYGARRASSFVPPGLAATPSYAPESASLTPRIHQSVQSGGPHLPSGTPNYSRVLVGSLHTTCQKLVDEDGKPGLFFFAHDLGIRTEGSFTLKFALANLTT
jgi:hypothetical protein